MDGVRPLYKHLSSTLSLNNKSKMQCKQSIALSMHNKTVTCMFNMFVN